MPQEIDQFLGIWYIHVRSENLDEFYNYMGTMKTMVL